MIDVLQTSVKGVHNTDFFSEENMNKLKEIMYEHKMPAGSRLFWEGDKADKLYFIKRGRVKITKSSDDGKTFILYMYGEADMFGQLDPFHNSTHGFNGEVMEDSTIGIIQQKDLEVLLWQHGDLAIEFMKWMGLMHRMTETKFRDIMMFGKPGALCSTLIRLANTYGKPHGTHTVISKKLTNSELADMIGATRESVNRMLSDLKKVEVIAYENNYIIIKRLDYLRDVCQCENCPKDMCRI
ncbi:Crp/Fnr family transcriptional regulator [Paenibacillus thalictri]|uniref:Crp/Fnr family transcriptional regulator n=1 Tax=Paenibacillus thalictri TaxID=2527873 RepID=A0A4Q9DU52_9BACL|nr:Crp/Fnr family transcriptional regulator [Paenibacillus thalictri]TBL78227.1 Crp/Fnr family transcriptional regulator [Paenibacillus thalictri]